MIKSDKKNIPRRKYITDKKRYILLRLYREISVKEISKKLNIKTYELRLYEDGACNLKQELVSKYREYIKNGLKECDKIFDIIK